MSFRRRAQALRADAALGKMPITGGRDAVGRQRPPLPFVVTEAPSPPPLPQSETSSKYPNEVED